MKKVLRNMTVQDRSYRRTTARLSLAMLFMLLLFYGLNEAANHVIQLGKAEGHEILTIEGVSHGEDLHPVQVAFIECGAVQCGYCTPGMVISAIGLLNKNPNPTRDEIALALENNLCRCTGYVKIIDAIELAAKRMRGEA